MTYGSTMLLVHPSMPINNYQEYVAYVRANPGNYINIMRESLAESFAVAFDRAALHDEGPDGTAGGGPFATYLDQTTKGAELGGIADEDLSAALDQGVAVLEELVLVAADRPVQPGAPEGVSPPPKHPPPRSPAAGSSLPPAMTPTPDSGPAGG